MPAEHVKAVEDAVPAWNDGDWDAVRESWHEDVVLEDHLLPDGGVYEGKDAVWARMSEIRALVGDWQIETQSIMDAGADVVWLTHITSRKDADAPPVDFLAGAIFSFEGNMVCRIRWFATPEAALEAAGLS
jgi:hypothetical protein